MKFYTNISKYGNNILVRGYEDGDSFQERVTYSPSMYVSSNNQKEMTHKSLYGKGLARYQYDTMSEMREDISNHSNVVGYNLCGMDDPIMQYISDNFFGIKPDLNLVRTRILDIECLADNGFPDPQEASVPISAICYYDTKDKKYYLFTIAEWDKNQSLFPEIAKDVIFIHCQTEKELLRKFLNKWKEDYCDIISGWNIESFDIPFIVNRMEYLDKSFSNGLSPWNRLNKKEVTTKYGSETIYNLTGISTLDYMHLYRKFTYGNPESMKLDHIGYIELNEHKVEFDGTYRDFCLNEPQKFNDYLLKDVNLVKRLDDKLRLLRLTMTMSYRNGTNFIDTLGTVKPWYTYISNRLMQKKIAIPVNREKRTSQTYEGAYVFDIQQGFVEKIASFDVNSLYPNLMISLNISPETILPKSKREKILDEILSVADDELREYINTEMPFIEYYLKHDGLPEPVIEILNKYNVSMSPNWEFYTKEFQGIIPELVSELYAERVTIKSATKDYKKELNKLKENHSDNSERIFELEELVASSDTEQHADKIALNSLYGALGCSFFPLYDIRNARSITLAGQLLIRSVAKYINRYIQKKTKTEKSIIVAGDTDSVSGDSLIDVNGHSMRIEDYYNSIKSGAYQTQSGTLIKLPDNPDMTLASDGVFVIPKRIKYVMKHKVKKRMYQIEARSDVFLKNHVVVTEDHSLIASRKGVLTEAKPSELQKYSDFLICKD